MANKIKHILLTAAIFMAAGVFGADFICADRECTVQWADSRSGTGSVALAYDSGANWYSGGRNNYESYTVVKPGYVCDWYTFPSDGTSERDNVLDNCTALLKSGSYTISAAEITAGAKKKSDKDYIACAKLTPAQYTVTLSPEGGSVSPTTIVVTFDAKYAANETSLPKATRTGYDFDGWFTAKTGGDKILWNTTVSTPNDHTLYAHWTAKSFTVTFDKNGGNTPSPSTKSVTYDSTYGDLAICTRTGYTFAGWYTAASGGTKVEATTKVEITANQTLYAHWTVNSFTVTFDANGGNAPSSGSKSVTYGSTYGTLATCTRTGYAFDGWYTAASGGTKVEATTKVAITANQTLYAHWTVKSFTVTFDKNGGNTPSLSSKSVTYDSTYGDLASCTRTGYTFDGWYTAASGGSKVEATTKVAITDNQTLYAHWTAEKFTVTFDANGGNTPSPTTKSVTYDSMYDDLASCSRTGYTFNGWFTAASGGTEVKATTKVAITANQTLYAHWTAKSFTVTLDANGGSTPSPSSKSVTYDSTYGALSNSTRTGYTFDGWYTAASGGSKIETTTKVTITANQTLYAHWTAQTFKITFDENGGNAPSPTSKTVTYDSPYGDLASCTWTGHTFDGWFTAVSWGTKVEATNTVAITANQTLYAHWTAESFTVTFDANGGNTPSPESKSVTYGSTYGTLATCTRTGYAFDGWYTAADGGSRVETTTRVAITANQTLYARWKANSYSVVFKANGASGTMDAQSFDYGESKALSPNVFVMPDQEFRGWKGSDGKSYTDGQVVSNLSSTAGATVTMTACWSENSYVQFVAEGAEGEMDLQQYDGDEGKPLTPNAYSRIGYTFDHWTNRTGAVFADAQYITNTLYVALGQTNTLFAVWSNNVYTISFDGNGATNTMESVSAVYDVSQKLYNRFAHPELGAKFIGWGRSADTLEYPLDSDKDFTTVVNLASESGAEVTLFARWAYDYGSFSEALDCDNLKFESTTWHVITNPSAAQFGDSYVVDNSGSGPNPLSAKGLIGSGTLSFWVKTVMEEDVLLVYVDGESIKTVSGYDYYPDWKAGEWFFVSMRLEGMTAERQLRFEHSYGSNFSCGIDHLSWTPDSENPEPTEDDAPVINGAASVEGGKFRVTFAADKRFKYELIKNETLAPSDWKSFDPQLFLSPDADGNISFEPAMETSKQRMFYRVKVLRKD